MKNSTPIATPKHAEKTILQQVDQVVGLEVRRVLLAKLTEIETDVIGRTHICNLCRKVFISRRKGEDIRWCGECRK